MEFIYLLTLCIDFSLPLAALASGMLLKQVLISLRSNVLLRRTLKLLIYVLPRQAQCWRAPDVVTVVVNTYHFANN